MLAALWEFKVLRLSDTGIDYKLTIDYEKILTFSLARRFACLSLIFECNKPTYNAIHGQKWTLYFWESLFCYAEEDRI